jgi:hypothetical protein
MRCRLCENETGKLAKAHIFPKGFFNLLSTKRRVDTISSVGSRGRRLQNAIYDPAILCQDCEHDIMQPLDDYSIRLIRDRESAVKVDSPHQASMGLWFFEQADKRKLCAFIASVLWRCSVSTQLELRDLSIGAFEDRVRRDLLSNGDFLYIDMVLFYLTDPLHGAFLVPYEKTLNPFDKTRDPEPVEGWVMQFPNISLTVSVDNRLHPHRSFRSLSPELTGRPTPTLISTSLHTETDSYKLAAFEAPRQDNIIENILRSVTRITHRSTGPQKARGQ